jgi:hypothetical protein
MSQQDYILRQIEMLGQMLIALRNRILGRKVDGPEAMQEVQSVVRKVGIDMEMR